MIPPFFRRSVSLRKRIDLPTSPGVYYLIQWFNPWKVLYVGKAANLRSRWSGKGHHKLKQALRKPGIRIHYRKTWTKGRAKEIEAIEQRKHNPPWNDRIEPLSPSLFSKLMGWLISIPISIALYLILLSYWQTPKQIEQTQRLEGMRSGYVDILTDLKAR